MRIFLATFIGIFAYGLAHAEDCNSVTSQRDSAVMCVEGIPKEVLCSLGTDACTPVPSPCATGMHNNIYTFFCTVKGQAPRDPEPVEYAEAEAVPEPLPAGGATSEAEVAAAKAKAEAEALAKEIEERNRLLAEELARKAAAAEGNQVSLLKQGEESNELGRSHAATVAALWCANGANSQKVNPEVAAESYDKCQKNYGAAKSIPSSQNGYKSDSSLLQGRAAQNTLENFEKGFGVSGEDYMGKMLGSGVGLDALTDMVKGKISEEDLATAMAMGGKGDDKFALSSGGGKAKQEKSLRDSLKAALVKAGKNLERAPTSVDKKSEEPTKIVGLKADSSLFASNDEKSKEEELTIFMVVHRKYEEMIRGRGL